MLTGRFSAAAEALQSNKYVMAATYDKAIEKGADRFNTVKNAVAELMGIEQSRVEEIKELTARAEKQGKIKSGAQVAMQRRINELRAQGLDKDKIQADPEFIKHSAAFKDASSTLAEIEARIEEKEKDLAGRKAQIAKFKAELQQMQRDQQSLREEKSEAMADVAVAQQMESVNAVLAGISEDTTDKDLAAARDARKRAKAKAEITSDLAGNDARVAESEYVALSATHVADKELDSLLDWGESKAEPAEKLEDAKLE
jgi:DNA repair exonuclease SbcCD ATPase subunit